MCAAMLTCHHRVAVGKEGRDKEGLEGREERCVPY